MMRSSTLQWVGARELEGLRLEDGGVAQLAATTLKPNFSAKKFAGVLGWDQIHAAAAGACGRGAPA